MASPYDGMKILVAAASDRANMVFQRMLEFQKFELAALVQHENTFSLALFRNWLIYATPQDKRVIFKGCSIFFNKVLVSFSITH